MKFETETGSLYEIDEAANRVRRLIGVKNPTPRQGNDGEWKTYEDHSPIVIGQSVLLWWAVESGVGKSTVTSLVKRILEDDQPN